MVTLDETDDRFCAGLSRVPAFTPRACAVEATNSSPWITPVEMWHFALRPPTANVAFESQWLHIEDGALWAGGFRSSPSAEHADRNSCRGDAIEVFAIDSGARTLAIDLPEETTWGYGTGPVVLAPGCRWAYLLGCDASLHVVDVRTRVTRQLYASPLGRDPGDLSPAIGHAALRDKWLYAGFSRGGFRLFRYDLNQD